MRTRISFVAMSLALIAVPGCDATHPFFFLDVDWAHHTWVRLRPAAYTFEVAIASPVGRTGYIRVEVEDGVVVSATDPEGNLLADFTLTIDSLWARLLSARERGELNSARFDRNGVPVAFDYGPWELDGGIGYTVRNFVRRR